MIHRRLEMCCMNYIFNETLSFTNNSTVAGLCPQMINFIVIKTQQQEKPLLTQYVQRQQSSCGLELRMTEVVSGDNWSYKTCKAPVKSSPSTNQHPMLLYTYVG